MAPIRASNDVVPQLFASDSAGEVTFTFQLRNGELIRTRTRREDTNLGS